LTLRRIFGYLTDSSRAAAFARSFASLARWRVSRSRSRCALRASRDVRQRRGLREERLLRLALALLGLEPAALLGRARLARVALGFLAGAALFLVAALAFFLLARLALELLAHLALRILLPPALGLGLRLHLAFLARLAVGGLAALALFFLALREGVEVGHERVEATSAGGRGRGGGG
jgi:hypothetical protein